MYPQAMRRLALGALILFFVLLYTMGLWARLGVPKVVIQGALSTLPLVILLCTPGSLGRLAPGFLFVWFYLGWSISACIYNGEGVVRGLLYARFMVTAYIVFWAIWNSRFTRRQLAWIHATIFAVFFLQVAAAAFELLVLGESVEANVGTMGHETGAIATAFPMFAFGYLLAFFLYYGRSVLLIAGLSFFLVGHASGKLATYYFLPAVLILGLVLYWAREGMHNAIKRSLVVLLIAICAMPFVLFLLSHTHRTQMLQNETGIYSKIRSFVGFTRETAIENKSWYTSTRTSTSVRIIEETVRRSPSVFLFGQGTYVFGEMSGKPDEGAYDEYGILYGVVGWSADALAVGWPAMFAQFGFYTYLFVLLLKRKRTLCLGTYWKAVLLAVELGYFVFLTNYFLYCTFFTIGGWISDVYLYFLAVLLAPQYRGTLCAQNGVALVSLVGNRGRTRSRLGKVEPCLS